jgi:NTP pyrophosphatase (non-canonical NTP hydrolase)
MEIKELEEKVTKKFLDNLKRDNIEVNDDYFILKLTEELGEFVQSYIIHKKKCRPAKYMDSEDSKKELSKELSDVLGLTLVIAKVLEIDLEETIIKKWITREWVK